MVSNGLDIKNKLWTSHGGSSDILNFFIIIHIDIVRPKKYSMDLLHGMRHNENLIQQYHNIKMHGKVKLSWEVKIYNNHF